MKNNIFNLSFLLLMSFIKINSEVITLPWCDTKSVLNLIKPYLPEDPIILEAGSYNGDDALTMSKLWPKGKVYAFEPVPALFEQVESKTKYQPNVYRYNYALSDKNGFAEFHLSEAPWAQGQIFASGSLLNPKEHLNYSAVTFPAKTKVETITIDSWAKLNNVDKIDLMWLDIQGSELDALKCGLDILKTVKVIYMEVEFVEAYEGQALFEDIKSWLEENNFKLLAKDFPDPEKKDSEWFGNAVFVRA